MHIRSLLSGVIALSSAALLVGCGSTTSGEATGGASAPSASSSPTPAGLTQAPDEPVSCGVIPPKQSLPTTPLPTVDPGGDFAPEVVWRKDELIVTAFGSSSCPPVAQGAVVVDSRTVAISFEGPPKQACTDDFAPHDSRIPAPSGDIDVESDVYATFDLEVAARQLIPVQLVHPEVD